jgi:hypothetical protein
MRPRTISRISNTKWFSDANQNLVKRHISTRNEVGCRSVNNCLLVRKPVEKRRTKMTKLGWITADKTTPAHQCRKRRGGEPIAPAALLKDLNNAVCFLKSSLFWVAAPGPDA